MYGCRNGTGTQPLPASYQTPKCGPIEAYIPKNLRDMGCHGLPDIVGHQSEAPVLILMLVPTLPRKEHEQSRGRLVFCRSKAAMGERGTRMVTVHPRHLGDPLHSIIHTRKAAGIPNQVTVGISGDGLVFATKNNKLLDAVLLVCDELKELPSEVGMSWTDKVDQQLSTGLVNDPVDGILRKLSRPRFYITNADP